MHLVIDGYNLLHLSRSLSHLNAIQLQRERDRLVDQLSVYRQTRNCEITVVFDGWESGWPSEKREKKKGIELIFSKLGEKADEVIKRLVKQKGGGAVVITSDREIRIYAERMAVAVIPSDRFLEKLEAPRFSSEEDFEPDEEETGMNKKGPSRRLSKKEKRARTALKKL